jgi:hypothetical protein
MDPTDITDIMDITDIKDNKESTDIKDIITFRLTAPSVREESPTWLQVSNLVQK